mgnify:CR=1
MKCKYMIEKTLHPTSASCIVRMWCKIKNKFCIGKCDQYKEMKEKKGSQK